MTSMWKCRRSRVSAALFVVSFFFAVAALLLTALPGVHAQQTDPTIASAVVPQIRPTASPPLVPLTGVTSIDAGDANTCAVLNSGALLCWGWNGFGKLGDGSGQDQMIPNHVYGLSRGVTKVGVGPQTTCAVTQSGAVKCWGDGYYGELGNGSSKTSAPTPIAAVGLSSGGEAAGTGQWHSCTLVDGGVRCWGDNTNGTLGDGSTDSHLTPVDVFGLQSGVAAISVGESHTCALTDAGGVNCWGVNWSGQLGDGTNTSRSTPVQVRGLTSGVRAISAGVNHTCALVSSGEVKCWGWGSLLGNGVNENNVLTPTIVSGLANVQAVDASREHTCVVMEAGGVKCWGRNDYGQLGTGETTLPIPTPVEVVGIEDAVAVAVGYYHTCALLESGGVQCWGRQDAGALGNGSEVAESVVAPTDVVVHPPWVLPVVAR